MIEQQINLPLIYQKNQEVFEFNPINITPPTKSPFYLACDDKLNDYYRHLKIFATLQKQNDQVLNNLWETVSKDKNMVENAQLSK